MMTESRFARKWLSSFLGNPLAVLAKEFSAARNLAHRHPALEPPVIQLLRLAIRALPIADRLGDKAGGVQQLPADEVAISLKVLAPTQPAPVEGEPACRLAFGIEIVPPRQGAALVPFAVNHAVVPVYDFADGGRSAAGFRLRHDFLADQPTVGHPEEILRWSSQRMKRGCRLHFERTAGFALKTTPLHRHRLVFAGRGKRQRRAGQQGFVGEPPAIVQDVIAARLKVLLAGDELHRSRGVTQERVVRFAHHSDIHIGLPLPQQGRACLHRPRHRRGCAGHPAPLRIGHQPRIEGSHRSSGAERCAPRFVKAACKTLEARCCLALIADDLGLHTEPP